eukprot:TRINITY_DN2719_c1_g2_i1.p1 TRINITY_DN2719_c1_g2~~TRINITY_DN2719_c1_g2_i1.p1  ORF type:complete len:421 (-),score=57.36 TRINITY_DN2719_c1_g2_i1:48-1286(-)
MPSQRQAPLASSSQASMQSSITLLSTSRSPDLQLLEFVTSRPASYQNHDATSTSELRQNLAEYIATTESRPELTITYKDTSEPARTTRTTTEASIVATAAPSALPLPSPPAGSMQPCHRCQCLITDRTFRAPPGAVTSREQCAAVGPHELPPCFTAVPRHRGTYKSAEAWSIQNCHKQYPRDSHDIRTILKCLTPSASARQGRVVFSIGDSHSLSVRPALRNAAGLPLYSFSYAGSFCSKDIDRNIYDALSKLLRKGDVVVLTHLIVSTEVAKQHSRSSTPHCMNAYKKRVQALHSLAKSVHANLVVLGDWPSPWPKPMAPKSGCSAQDVPRCGLALKDVSNMKRQFASFFKSEGVLWIDSHRWFCTDAYCTVHAPGTETVIYMDYDHLNSDGNSYIEPFLCSALKDLQIGL